MTWYDDEGKTQKESKLSCALDAPSKNHAKYTYGSTGPGFTSVCVAGGTESVRYAFECCYILCIALWHISSFISRCKHMVSSKLLGRTSYCWTAHSCCPLKSEQLNQYVKGRKKQSKDGKPKKLALMERRGSRVSRRVKGSWAIWVHGQMGDDPANWGNAGRPSQLGVNAVRMGNDKPARDAGGRGARHEGW